MQLKCDFPEYMKVSGYTTLLSDTKISKLILCFSILLLQIRQYTELMHKRPANIDQFTTSQIELS